MVANPIATPALVVILPGYFGPEPIETFSVFTSNCCFAVVSPNCLNPTTGSSYKNSRSRLQELEVKTTRIRDQDYKICKKSFVGPILWSQLVGCEPILWLQLLQSDLLCGLNLLKICKPVFLFCWIHRFKGDLKFHPL